MPVMRNGDPTTAAAKELFFRKDRRFIVLGGVYLVLFCGDLQKILHLYTCTFFFFTPLLFHVFAKKVFSQPGIHSSCRFSWAGTLSLLREFIRFAVGKGLRCGLVTNVRADGLMGTPLGRNTGGRGAAGQTLADLRRALEARKKDTGTYPESIAAMQVDSASGDFSAELLARVVYRKTADGYIAFRALRAWRRWSLRRAHGFE